MIYQILNLFGLVVTFAGFLSFVGTFFTLVKNKQLSFEMFCEEIRSMFIFGQFTLPILVVALAGILVTDPTMHELAGIHNLELKPDGTYCFFVEATNRQGKTYVLPAEVEVAKDGDGNRTYYINKVVFSNGGYLRTSGEEVDIGGMCSFFDDGDRWSLVLLNKHAYSPYITETSVVTVQDISFVVLEVFCICMQIYIYLKKRK